MKCPFCGGEPSIIKGHVTLPGSEFELVANMYGCDNEYCYVQPKVKYVGDDSGNCLLDALMEYLNLSYAIKYWEKRI